MYDPLKLRIDVLLPKNRDLPGKLFVIRSNQPVLEVPCLGDSANELANAAGNPTHDPIKRNGQTPTGSYIAQNGVEIRPVGRREGFGVCWIPLDPISGEALAAENAGRAGLAIHGGRGDRRLVPTAGCIRVLDKDFLKIHTSLGDLKQILVQVFEHD